MTPTKSTNGNRVIPLHPLLKLTLSYWWAEGWQVYTKRAPCKDDPIFPRGVGRAKGVGALGDFCFSDDAILLRLDLQRVGALQTMAGVQLDFHALRKTFATCLNGIGATSDDVGALLGHASKSVTTGHYMAIVAKKQLDLITQLPIPPYITLKHSTISL